MNLIEHQSTFNLNMPLRGLGYFGDSYKQFVSESFGSSAAIYSDRRLPIPTPKYYVFYNGLKSQPEEMELRLSDAYEGELIHRIRKYKEGGLAEGFTERGYEDVDKLVAEGTFNEEKACAVLGVSLEKYRDYSTKRV